MNSRRSLRSLVIARVRGTPIHVRYDLVGHDRIESARVARDIEHTRKCRGVARALVGRD